jgi:hypothetical protein
VSNDLDAGGILVGNDGQFDVTIDDERGIDQLAIDAAGKRSLGQASTDVGGHLGNSDVLVETAFRAVGQTNDWHGGIPEKESAAGPHLVKKS